MGRGDRIQLTYRGLIEHLAGNPGARDWSRVGQLPELNLEQLGAVLEHYPDALLEAFVTFDPTCTKETRKFLGTTERSDDLRLSLVGTVFVCALQRYVMPLVLRDVQIQVGNNIIADRIEAQSLAKEVLTADQIHAFELGVGRMFS